MNVHCMKACIQQMCVLCIDVMKGLCSLSFISGHPNEKTCENANRVCSQANGNVKLYRGTMVSLMAACKHAYNKDANMLTFSRCDTDVAMMMWLS